MKRWSFLKDALPLYSSRPEVSEIVVCDETGEDAAAIAAAFCGFRKPEQFDAIAAPSFYTNSKLRVYTNESRLGIYENKYKAFSLATNPWVALLDSDNIFNEEWFDTVSTLDFTQPKTIYASADFKTINTMTGAVAYPCAAHSGLKLSAKNWNEFLKIDGSHLLLNDGNLILPKEALESLPKNIKSSQLLACDAIFKLRCFVKNGFTIHYVKDLEYIHMVHPGSSWLQTDADSSAILLTTNWRL